MNNYKDFTYDEKRFTNLPTFVDDLHAKGRKVVIVLVIFFVHVMFLGCKIHYKKKPKKIT